MVSSSEVAVVTRFV